MPDLYSLYTEQQTDELVEVLDDKGRAFMVMSLAQAHKQGLCYQLVIALLYCPQGLLYIQQRSRQSPLFPDIWDVSSVVPVRANEAPADAVSRGLYEALRVRPTNCVEMSSELRKLPYGVHRVVTFQALAPSQTPAPDSRFVDRLIKVNALELELILKDFPDQASPALCYIGEKGLAFKKA